jgi:hypothetical protein
MRTSGPESRRRDFCFQLRRSIPIRELTRASTIVQPSGIAEIEAMLA